LSHPVHQGRVVDTVEAGFDVTFEHPTVSVGGEVTCLGDGVVCPPTGTETMRTRFEIRLEDRFEHQFQGCLHTPVGSGWYSQGTQLAVPLGDPPLPNR
jgi:site-specific DNA recombinase